MNNQYLKRIQYSSELGQHKQNVAQLLVHFAYYLDLELENIERSYLVGMLHDSSFGSSTIKWLEFQKYHIKSQMYQIRSLAQLLI